MYNLSNEEKSYLRKIVESTRKDFFIKNKYGEFEEDIENVNEKYLISIENIEINFEVKYDNELSPLEIEKVFRDSNINKIVKALTLREKLVLFSYYFENKTDSEVGKLLSISADTARKIRTRALKKIKDKYLSSKGDTSDV